MAVSHIIFFVAIAIHCLFSSFTSCLDPLDQFSSLALEDGAIRNEGCSIEIKGGLPDPQPLILRPEATASFVLPDPKGTIHVPRNTSLRLVCTGSSNTLAVAGTPEANVTCISETTFFVPAPSGRREMANFSALTCSKIPYHTARYALDGDRDCRSPNNPIEIGFVLPRDGSFLRLIDGCYDNTSLNALYTRFDMPASISGRQKEYPRAGFLQGKFYPGLRVNAIYSRNKQRETISKLLGSEELGSKYIKQTGDHYLSRGHLAARADFIYKAQQRSTFYFVNAAPQWQTLNGNNWNALEIDLRNLVASSNYTLTVWTGTHGVATLPDVNGNDQELGLVVDENNNRRVDVPALFWKVARESNSGLATAFVGVNNPYLDPVPDSLILCESVCDELKWLTWSPKNIKKGYSYCCDVDMLRDTIETIPMFKTNGLLK